MGDLVARVSEKGQITIPAEVRRRLDIQSGDRVLFHLLNGEVALEKVPTIQSTFGTVPSLGDGRTIEEVIREARVERHQERARGA